MLIQAGSDFGRHHVALCIRQKVPGGKEVPGRRKVEERFPELQ